ncbi:uncharacterized protein [Aristolochia californica]|uniref:uncharacterized protein isoform X2 n=1 Tax=Aristolochia californica TaxID=171875 RepID=UPI0035D90E08
MSMESHPEILRVGPRGTEEAAESITLREWQAWGTSSQIPSRVVEVIEDLKLLETDIDADMNFGGLGGKLQGDFKVQEDKKHRATYQSLNDSEDKLKFFAARQIACRLLGSRGYLCQKDFLRQNNTGKLLWQVFGIDAATLCLFGIHEQEEIMWNIFKLAGKGKLWCLYPNKNAPTKSVEEMSLHGLLRRSEDESSMTGRDAPLNFILIDGTWNNSAAMFRRLKEKAKSLWGEEYLPCISLSTSAVSAMHKLRPQPSWDRTCTAAAAASLLLELHHRPEFSNYKLDEQAEAVENALDVLLEALTARRVRMGRSLRRRQRHDGIKVDDNRLGCKLETN